MTAAALALALAAQASDTGAGRPCVLVIDSIGGTYREVAAGPGLKNAFAGGGILAHCRGTGSLVAADSMAHYGGPDRLDLIGQVKIRDTVFALDATTAAYYLGQERLEAHRNVVATNRRTGSVLRGPNVTYLRTARGVRDTSEMSASGRPTIDYRSATDSGEPYVIVADRVRFKGDDRFWGGGQVTIDRSDFAARGDSVMLDERAGLAVLVGKPSVEGKGAGAYTLAGRRIELALERREVRRAKALGNGSASSSDWRLTGDTIHLDVDARKVQRVFAWGDSLRPLAASAKTTVRADSLALDTPGQVLDELRAYGRAHSTSARDSAADSSVGNDWIEGDTLVARFEPATDATGKRTSRLKTVLATGAARSLMHLKKGTDHPCWSRNYSRGRRIAIALVGDSLDQVVVSGHADGAHLECFAAVDTTAAPPRSP
jgi:hypothetical protein